MSAVGLEDAKKHLNISDANHNNEIQAMLNTAEAAIAHRVGPLEPTAHTQRVVGSGGPLVLQVTPVVSVTSLTPVGGTAADLSTLDVDLGAGVITRASSTTYASGYYDVVYQAGRVTLPADLRLAVLELVRHFWQTQRGPTARPGTRDSDAASNTVPGAAYMFPFRVEQLLAPHDQLGFA